VPEPSRAVFLSYASQDAAAARRICDALLAAGIEVWFDQSELRGGDAWDQMIRRQIKACAIFIPVISHQTHERREGYFRLEWNLAVDRSKLISTTHAFLVPVVIDDTREDDEEVPEKIRDVHWTRLPGGETPAAFVERIKRLLSGEAASARSAGSGVVSGALTARTYGRQRTGAVYAAIAAAILLTVVYFGLERLRGSASPTQGAASIAVLPLANESGDASQQYFSDGISEDLITALSQFTGLKVIGRSSAFKFRDSKEDSHSIGAKLGVAHLVEGSVRRAGDTVRVSAELIDTADGSTQWSERYDRPYKDLFSVQDDITHAVVSALRVKLLPTEHAAAQSERPPSGSLEAYNAVLQARFYGERGTEANLRKAIEFLTRATELDPNYAFAWSVLAVPWLNLGGQYLEGASAQDAYAKARAATDRALALAPELAVAHVARGSLLEQADFNWRGAEAEYRRALALAPNEFRAEATFADLHATLGDIDSAIDLMRQVITHEPLRANLYALLSGYLLAVNRLDEAEQAIRRAMELQPGAEGIHWQLAAIEVQRGHAQAALAAAHQESPGALQDSALALALQIGPDRNAADAALETLIKKDADGSAFQVAEVYGLRNDAKSTFDWLDRAWSNRDPGISQVLWDPFILRYRNDPRFAAFCRKVGLPMPDKASTGKAV
jgi:TolB-like protein/Tfp pilus assembly protein PilF